MLGDSCFSEYNEKPEEKRGYLQSSSFKMALIFAILLGVAGGILGYFHYYFNKGHYISGAERLIHTELNQLVALWPTAGGPKMIADLLTVSGPDFQKIYAVQDVDDNLFLGNVSRLPHETQPLGKHSFTFYVNGENDGRAKEGLYAGRFHEFEDGTKLMVALYIGDVHKKYLLLQNLSILTMGLMLTVVLVSFAISTFVVSRTNRIANTARDIIETGDLSRRITIDSTWDDLSYLGSILNQLLNRMENLVFGVRQISDNIAHDMRTPLTRLRTHLETLLEDARVSCNDNVRERAEILIDDADHMMATFNALLRIGKLETSQETLSFAESNINHLMRDVIELYEPSAEDKNISLNHHGEDIILRCDHHLLFQALANVVDNALKFTPEHGSVTTSVKLNEKMISIRIADTGAGVPDDEKKRVFNRFFRGDKSRNSPGTGLGLALVAAIVRLHKGHISLYDNNPGLIVDINLPRTT